MTAITVTPSRNSIAKYLASGALAILALAFVTVWNAPFRHFEAVLSAKLVGIFTSTAVYQDAWFVHGHQAGGMWFVVTTACSSALIVTPLLLVGAWFISRRSIPFMRALTGLVAGVALVLIVNTLRETLIGLAWRAYGDGSIWLTHLVIGSFISLFAAIAAIAVFLLAIGIRRKKAAREFN
ncbi:archaeosortase/exosortase family protein [Ferrimicrobium acidiphilum]|jgi:exosortase/archaeosortase family protein|uniref:archaeosortase/exosortase family protein n=1 Tax=Ferrimicrobium acidiphilum TaxID=121039 RepID=UPI0023F2FF0D|nr:archaeosortase/exosortase family protein [Ferrimicrobium acidiphilum]